MPISGDDRLLKQKMPVPNEDDENYEGAGPPLMRLKLPQKPFTAGNAGLHLTTHYVEDIFTSFAQLRQTLTTETSSTSCCKVIT